MWIINGRIFPMTGPVIEKGYVKTEGDKIVKIGEMQELSKNGERPLPDDFREWPIQGDSRELPQKSVQPPSGTNGQVLDVSGAWVLPGLIEAHAHIGITEEKTGFTGDDSNEQTNPVFPALRAIDAINPMDPAFHDAIQAGITSVMAGPGSADVVGGQFVFMKTHGRCVDDMTVKNPAAMKAAFGENPKTAYGDQGRCPSTRMGVAALLRRELFRAVQYRDMLEREPGAKREFDLEPWLPVLAGEIPLKVHAHRADDIFTAIRIAREYNIKITLDHCTEGHLIAEKIKESGFPAIVGPSLTSRSKPEVEYLSFKTPHILWKAGVKTAVTTDHPVVLIQFLPICAGLAVKHGLPTEEGLRAITLYPAQICGTDDRVGSLEPGKDADIAVFDGNPMEIFTRTLYTIINGEIVYEGNAGPGNSALLENSAFPEGR